jgi:predicted lysophospholipase L1 biosynthesis ABC-type transport system permease subunit
MNACPSTDEENKPAKLPESAHLVCGWPLLLTVIGGAIGGALSAGAYAVNLSIYKSNLPAPTKVVLNLCTGLTAFFLWVAAATAIHSVWK